MLQYTKEVISLSEKRTHYPTIKDVAKLANTSTATVLSWLSSLLLALLALCLVLMTTI